MRYYIDTSAIVAAHCTEPETERVQEWLAHHSLTDLVISSWLLTEMESALSIKERRGEINTAQHRQIAKDIAVFGSRLASIEIPASTDFEVASKFCSVATSRLRAGDAIHLAIALRLKSRYMITLDDVLMENAMSNGLLNGLVDR